MASANGAGGQSRRNRSELGGPPPRGRSTESPVAHQVFASQAFLRDVLGSRQRSSGRVRNGRALGLGRLPLPPQPASVGGLISVRRHATDCGCLRVPRRPLWLPVVSSRPRPVAASRTLCGPWVIAPQAGRLRSARHGARSARTAGQGKRPPHRRHGVQRPDPACRDGFGGRLALVTLSVSGTLGSDDVDCGERRFGCAAAAPGEALGSSSVLRLRRTVSVEEPSWNQRKPMGATSKAWWQHFAAQRTHRWSKALRSRNAERNSGPKRGNARTEGGTPADQRREGKGRGDAARLPM